MSNELIIATVEPPLLEYFWNECVPILNRVMVLAPEELSLETTKEAIMSGRNRLVIVLDGKKIIAVNVLDILVFDTGIKVLTIPITAGDRLEDWAERFLNLCHMWGKNMGCSELRNMACRKGWSKFLKQYGWSDHFMVMRCPIEGSETNKVTPINKSEQLWTGSKSNLQSDNT